MTNTPMIDGVLRELLVTANVCVMRSHVLLVEQLKKTDHKDDYRAEIARLKDAHEKIKMLLKSNKNTDAPAVERQEPVCATCNGTKVVDEGEINHYPGGIPYSCGPVKCIKDCPDCQGAPEVSALQSTIAQLQAENSRVNYAWHDMKRELDLAKARMQERESGRGEPVGQVVEFGKGLKEVSWIKERMPKLGAMLFTTPPAPVAAVMPSRRKRDWMEPTDQYSDGWNACLDATAALNGEQK